MKPGKVKPNLQVDELREALKGKVRHPYITGQGLAEEREGTEETSKTPEPNASKGKSGQQGKED